MDYMDCHADTLTQIPRGEDLLYNSCNYDLVRVHQFAKKHTQIFALWKDRAQLSGTDPKLEFQKMYEQAVQLLQGQPEYVVWCKNVSDMHLAHAQGKTAAFLAIEDISVMGSMAEQVRALGIRFAMLTWNYENEYACGAAAGQGIGLTKAGRTLVQHLLNQQIVLDISHLSDQGIEDIFQMTDQPVMASHSNVRSVCSHARNLQAVQIRELIRRGGIMGLNFYAPFVGEQPSMADLLRHLDAVLQMGGEDILAIGSDFDGCENQFLTGITGVQDVLHLRELLEREGFGSRLIQKIFYENAAQFLTKNLREDEI